MMDQVMPGDKPCPQCGFWVYNEETFCLHCELALNLPSHAPKSAFDSAAFDTFRREKAFETWFGILFVSCAEYFAALAIFAYFYTGGQFELIFGKFFWNSCLNLPLAAFYWGVSKLAACFRKEMRLHAQIKLNFIITSVLLGLIGSAILFFFLPQSISRLYAQYYRDYIVMNYHSMETFWLTSFWIGSFLLSGMFTGSIWLNGRCSVRERLNRQRTLHSDLAPEPFNWKRWFFMELMIPLLLWFWIILILISV